MRKERKKKSKMKTVTVVITNASADNANMTLEEIIKRHLIEKAKKIKERYA